MADTHDPKFEISANGTSDAYELGQVEHKVMIYWPASVSAGSIAVQTGIDADHMITIDTVTGSEVIYVKGPGKLQFVTSSYGGSGSVRIDIGELLP